MCQTRKSLTDCCGRVYCQTYLVALIHQRPMDVLQCVARLHHVVADSQMVPVSIISAALGVFRQSR